MASKISRGWTMAENALKVLNANKQLIVFPILSGITILIITASFFAGFLNSGWLARFGTSGNTDMIVYLFIFLFYVVTYFVVVFFNMALIHCTTLYFKGEEATVAKGISFSFSKLGAIIGWAVFSATIGLLLRMLQDKLGWIGKLFIGVLGMVWNAATFFVIPVIAYEESNPLEAVKHSTHIMKEKWGESIVANFSFSLLALGAILCFGIVGIAISELVNLGLGIAVFVGGLALTFIVTSAVRTIIVSAAYYSIDGDIDQYFNQKALSELFCEK